MVLYLYFSKETKVRIHNLSVLSPNPSVGSRNKNISYFPSEWIVYEEMSRNNRLASVRCCTMISPITVALFTGPAKLSPEIIKEAEGNITAGNLISFLLLNDKQGNRNK